MLHETHPKNVQRRCVQVRGDSKPFCPADSAAPALAKPCAIEDGLIPMKDVLWGG